MDLFIYKIAGGKSWYSNGILHIYEHINNTNSAAVVSIAWNYSFKHAASLECFQIGSSLFLKGLSCKQTPHIGGP